MSVRFPARWPLAVLTFLAAACSDAPTVAPGARAPAAVPPATATVALQCQGNVATRTVSCVPPTATSVGGNGDIIVGGQHQYVDLASSNVSYDGTSHIFAFDVTVTNKIPQAMGTTDGATADPNGVRVFFNSGPTVTGGTGNAAVSNADGTGNFTGSNQPYFQYSGTALGADGILSNGETSSARNWQLNVDPTATTFTFLLYVTAAVQYPGGWVDLSPATPNMTAGATQALTPTVRSSVGDALSGQTVTWGTSDATVATVDGSGNVTAVAPGGVTITATAGSRTGRQTLQVCPNLAVGGAYTTSGTGAATVCLAGGASGNAEYVVMPVNTHAASSLPVTVTGTGVVGVTGPPTPDIIPAAITFKVPDGEDLPDGAWDAHLREQERTTLASRVANRGSRIGGGRSGVRRVIVQGVVPAVGDTWGLNVNSNCSGSADVRTGVVRKVSQHLIIVSDTANPAGGFTTAQYDSIALEFDTLSWVVDSTNFGPPTDEDGNGHVVAFFTRAVNELSPPGSSTVTLGFFASKDVFSNDPVNGCSNSNMGEMFYMLVPDPTGAVNTNVRTVSFVRGNTTGTMAHEFQHMINAFRREYVTGASAFEDGWLNEGLSHIAEELMFYRASGMSPRVNIKLGTDPTSGIQLNSKRVAAFNAYANSNFGRLRNWLTRPDTAGAFESGHQNSLAVRGVIWEFLRYAADRVGGTESAFWYNLVNDNLQGVSNIQNAIGGADPNAWLRDDVAAFYADDNAGITGLPSQYLTPSWNYRNMYSALGGYSLPTIALTNGVAQTRTLSFGGGTMFGRFGVASGGFGTITTTAGGSLPATLQYTVMRTK